MIKQISTLDPNSSSPPSKAIPRTEIPPSITADARSLGSRPKGIFRGRRRIKRKWSGFVQGQRCWRGKLVQLPDGTVVEVIRAYRGSVLVRTCQQTLGGADRQVCVSAWSLRIYKVPEAVRLGRFKLGVQERKSTKKAEACRRNAKMPARPGHRKRGRPRKNAAPWELFVFKSRTKPPQGMTFGALSKWAAEQQVELSECLRTDAAKREREAAGLDHVYPA